MKCIKNKYSNSKNLFPLASHVLTALKNIEFDNFVQPLTEQLEGKSEFIPNNSKFSILLLSEFRKTNKEKSEKKTNKKKEEADNSKADNPAEPTDA